MVEIDAEKCIGCGTCEQICPISAFKIVSNIATVVEDNAKDCIQCKNCESSCPVGAITV